MAFRGYITHCYQNEGLHDNLTWVACVTVCLAIVLKAMLVGWRRMIFQTIIPSGLYHMNSLLPLYWVLWLP